MQEVEWKEGFRIHLYGRIMGLKISLRKCSVPKRNQIFQTESIALSTKKFEGQRLRKSAALSIKDFDEQRTPPSNSLI